MRNLQFVDDELKKIKKNGEYRSLTSTDVNRGHIEINNIIHANLCSNDYLGLDTPFDIYTRMQSSSRLLAGHDDFIDQLENMLAKYKSQQRALVYPTGYMANLGVISTLAGEGSTIFSDAFNHASIIDACRLSKAKTVVYGHNDMENLESGLKKEKGRKFIVTEGVFSMDGDLADLKGITDLAEKYDAYCILDDAHGDFVIGRDGKGTAYHLGVAKKIDVYTGSLSKALGAFGGFIASRKNVIDLCVNRSNAFIYTTALPSGLAWHAIQLLQQENMDFKRRRLVNNIKRIAKGLHKLGYDIKSSTHIIPIMIGDEKKAVKFSRDLSVYAVFAPAIRYPTVPRGQARIRISVTSHFTREDTDIILKAFDHVGRMHNII